MLPIVEADVFLRVSSFNNQQIISDTAFTPNTQLKDYDLNMKWAYLLTLHEFGHALGRVHNHHQGSIMQPAVQLSQLKIGLNDFDITTMGEVYSLRANPIGLP